MRTSADLLAASKAQARNMQRTTLVSNLRALEAQNVLKSLRAQGEGEGAFGQMASGPGFGFAEPEAKTSDLSAVGGDLAKAVGSAQKGISSLHGLVGKLAAGGPDAALGDLSRKAAKAAGGRHRDGDPIDMASLELKDKLNAVVTATWKARSEADRLARFIGQASDKANVSLRDAAEDLRIPGFPPAALAKPPAPRPLPAKPADLAPAWLDFLFSAGSPGTSPYPALRGASPLDVQTESNLDNASHPEADLRADVGSTADKVMSAGKAFATGKPMHVGGLLKALA